MPDPIERWINVYTDTDRAVVHDSMADATAELIERAESRGEDRVTDYWRTICAYEIRGQRAESYTMDLKPEADEAMDRADRERHVARYAPSLVE